MDKTSSKLLKLAVELELANLLQALSTLDFAIAEYNKQLERIQPLLSGRVLVKFSNSERIVIHGDTQYDLKPCIGKMVKVRGGWKFFWIKNPDVKNLHELRVGKGIKGDSIVVKILKSLSEMILRREELVSEIKQFRLRLSKSVQSVDYLHARKMNELWDIIPRIKVDWSKDADELYKKFKLQDEAPAVEI